MKISWTNSLRMIGGYARLRVQEQVRAVAFIIAYLIIFQLLILRAPLEDALALTLGGSAVVIGLALFLEGLVLGLMPLGELAGVKLPQRVGLAVILLFGLFVGLGSTLAEPAFAALRLAGRDVTPWGSPLLYVLLEQHSYTVILSIAGGVGVAVALGMLRFSLGFSLKPLVFSLIPLLLILSLIASRDPKVRSVIGLAWDSGAVTTVPLVLALGIGVSRSSGNRGEGGGFGVIMLASALPVASVLLLAMALAPSVPDPVEEEHFFSPAYRERALEVVIDEGTLLRSAFSQSSEAGRRAFFSDGRSYEETLHELGSDFALRESLLEGISFRDWVNHRASDFERRLLDEYPLENFSGEGERSGRGVFSRELQGALRAVVPISALLIALLFLLRERPRYIDEVLLGIVFALLGMTFLTSGIHFGLGPLGDMVGREIPRAYRSSERGSDRIVIDRFDPELVFESISADGEREQFFFYHRGDQPQAIPFRPEQFDPHRQRYEHRLQLPPLFGPNLTALGIALVLLFAFGLGFGSTLAEPALRALGRTVEELTVGTIRGQEVVLAVSIGVGVGIVAGVCRILFDFPLLWILGPAYLVLLLLTAVSSELMTSISWDCGGVTTGPVTVPLVLALGLGLGGELATLEGFGVLALASAFPIISVQLFGLIAQFRQGQAIAPDQEAQ
ncbi:DUF1538 family protein [Alkalispirochaeta alkalica]|uniref:DUF1538 family protein n=1 Tax=Alkalispirochaeta alkalica TaxID=46356 RepID=UPI00047816E3|nr:DUF1538 family protein [Alkalispirochaeta alkalica]